MTLGNRQIRICILSALFLSGLGIFGMHDVAPAFADTTWWWNVGGPIGSIPTEWGNGVRNASFATSSTGALYGAYIDIENGSGVTVKALRDDVWTIVGTPGFSSWAVYNPIIRIAPNGTPYVLYVDLANGNSYAVKRFNGSNWIDVSSSSFSGIVQNNRDSMYSDLAIAPDGTPYIFLSHKPTASLVGKGAIFRYSGSAWSPIGGQYDINGNAGSTFFVNGFISSIKIAFTRDSTPYFHYEDYGDNGANGALIKIYRYSGGSMTYVWSPNAGISGYDDWSAFAIGPDDSLYVGYGDGSDGGRAVVKKWNGSGWNIVGNTHLGTGAGYLLDLLVDLSGNLYFILCDQGNSYAKNVYFFDGTSWSMLGSGGFFSAEPQLLMDPVTGTVYSYRVQWLSGINSASLVTYKTIPSSGSSIGTEINGSGTGMTSGRSLAFDSTWTGYALFVDYSAGRNTTVMRRSANGTWTALGGAGAIPTATGSSNFVWFITIAPDDTPYVLFRDGSAGAANGRVSVVKWNGSAWTYVGGSVGLSSWQATVNGPLIFSADGKPYATYRDITTGYVAARYFDGTSWQNVGPSETIVSYTSSIPYPAFAPNGNLYVVFHDASPATGRGPSVIRWDGSSWSQVGNGRIGTYSANTVAYSAWGIQIGNDGTPYILATDMSTSTSFPTTYLWKFNGTSWVHAATAIGKFAAGARFAAASNGTIYIGYAESYDRGIASGTPYTYPITVKRFTGSDWAAVGTEYFTVSQSTLAWPAINPLNGLPYLMVVDANQRISVSSPLLLSAASTSVSMSVNQGGINMEAPASITFPSSTISSSNQTLSFSGGAFILEDLKWASNWYYATISMGNLTNGSNTISASNVFGYVSSAVTAVAGNSNSAVSTPSTAGTIGAGYVSLDSAKTLVQRSSNGGILGRYSIPLSLRITIPAYTPAGSYTGTMTITVIEN